MTPWEHDLLVRTVLGEAGGEPPEGQQAVAAVALNRLRSGQYGKDMAGVLLQPNAFESWSRPNQAMYSDASSPAYTGASQAVDAAAGGDDPTGGAVNFLNPDLQTADGRPIPKWAQGDGQRIGQHVFYGGKPQMVADKQTAPASDAFSAAFGDVQGAADKPAPDPFSAAFGDVQPTDKPTAAAPAPTAAPALLGFGDTMKNLGMGALRGVVDVGDTVSERGLQLAGGAAGAGQWAGIVPPDVANNIKQFGSDYTAKNKAARDAWVAAHANDPALFDFSVGPMRVDPSAATVGRLVGQMAATAPVLAATGPIGATGNALVDAGLTGSVMGGESSAMTTSASDEPPAQQILQGAALGGVVGAAAPAVGGILKAGANKVARIVTELGDSGVAHVKSLLDKIGMTPQEAQQAVHTIGPSATLADLDPALQTEAGALAARGGDTTSTIRQRYAARAAAGGQRTAQGIDAALGPMPDKTLLEQQFVADAQTKADPSYRAAYANSTPMDVQPVLNKIDGLLQTATGRRANALNEFKNYLLDANGKPKTDIEALHAARQEMDDYINKAASSDSSAGRIAVAKLGQVRSSLDQILKSDPDMAKADQVFAEGMRVKDFFEQGQQVFDNKTRLPDLQRQLATATPDQLKAYQQGARIALGDKVGASSRGELTDTQQLFGKKTANREKLKLAFPTQADDVLDMVAGNQAMRTTENKTLSPSATAEYSAAQQRYKPAPSSGNSMADIAYGVAAGAASGDPFIGAITGGAHKVAGIVGKKLQAAHFDRLATDTAHALSASGPELDAILKQIGNWVASAPRRAVTNKLVNLGAGAVPLAARPRGPQIGITDAYGHTY